METTRFDTDWDDVWQHWLIVDKTIEAKDFEDENLRIVARCDDYTDAETLCECLNVIEYKR